MGNIAEHIPAFRFGHKVYPQNMVEASTPVETGQIWFVDGDKAANGDGKTWEDAFADLESACNVLSAGDVIYVATRSNVLTDTDPISYTENAILDTPNCSIIGVSRGRTQGGLPQLKVGTTTTQAILTVRAPGCLIANLGFNGAGATGGGILLDDDGGSTKSAFGTMIVGCHFKNCKGTDATGAETGGAIQWSAAGGAWQVSIVGNQFYKNVGDITLMGTSGSVPQDVLIANNDFLGTAAAVDCHIFMAGSGMANFMIRDNYFAGVLPALSGGNNVRYVILVGTGLFANNYFASTDTTTGFGAAKASAKIPTTVGIPHNYSDGGLIVREA